MTKKLQQSLDILGADYTILNFDGENCIYRKFSDGIEVEVSGLNDHKLDYEAIVYVWVNEKIYGSIPHVHSPEALKTILSDFDSKRLDYPLIPYST